MELSDSEGVSDNHEIMTLLCTSKSTVVLREVVLQLGSHCVSEASCILCPTSRRALDLVPFFLLVLLSFDAKIEHGPR